MIKLLQAQAAARTYVFHQLVLLQDQLVLVLVLQQQEISHWETSPFSSS
jgi:hypothetical protein